MESTVLKINLRGFLSYYYRKIYYEICRGSEENLNKRFKSGKNFLFSNELANLGHRTVLRKEKFFAPEIAKRKRLISCVVYPFIVNFIYPK